MKKMRGKAVAVVMAVAGALAAAGMAADVDLSRRPLLAEADEFKVKREAVYEFAQRPVVTREADKVTVAFESKGLCDVTVAIEDARGRIVRHLASGVLGAHAPAPFEKNAKAQTLVWDGKDDAEAYVDDKRSCVVRVSLGLRPQFERTLFWHPAKSAGGVLVLAPGPAGVLVFQSGNAVDHLRLFDRDGNYVRTVYPFPAGQMDKIPGLIRHRFPDGVELPVKPNWLQSSLLMSGSNCTKPTYSNGKYQGYGPRGTELTGSAGFALAVAGDRIALAGNRLSRLSLDGTAPLADPAQGGGLTLHGPDLLFQDRETVFHADSRRGEDDFDSVSAKHIALSPEGQWLYLARFNETRAGSFGRVIWRNMVMRLPYDRADGKPEIFAGTPEPGKGEGEFNMPAGVTCDSQGRVYVADHLNDRVQVLSADGKLLKSIPVRRPAEISVHHKTGEIFVFSWALPLHGRTSFLGTSPSLERKGEGDTYFRLTKFSALDEAKLLAKWDLQPATGLARTRASNVEIHAVVDTWSEPVRVWITAPSPVNAREPRGHGIVLLTLEGDTWTVKRDLLDEAAHAIVRVHPAPFNRQRLCVNPADGLLYLVEGDTSHGTAFQRMLRIDPQTGRVGEVELPMSSEDLAFDRDGNLYLRTSDMILRYTSDTLREIPFDYGEERQSHHFGNGGGERSARVLGGAIVPGNKGFHQGGMSVSPRGHIVISALYDSRLTGAKEDTVTAGAKPYRPLMYPGRRWGNGSRLGCLLVNILDRHGKVIHADAVPGLGSFANGTAIDAGDNIYLLHPSPQVFNGERHFNDHAGTLMKFTPGKGRLLAADGAPVPLDRKPDRPPDLALPSAWVEGAEWMYAGVGWGGHNYSSGCSCPNARFALDYFARSFTPEIDRYNVGVVDSSGNLILRVGQPGNVDEGMPLVKDGGPPSPRSIGGDETALFFAPYVATYTDHRLFIADPGNARIVSVNLGYHAEEKIALKDVPEPDGRRP